MPINEPSKSGDPELSSLLPERTRRSLGERPTLPFESDEDFDALHAQLIVALDPQDFMDEISVWEIACAQWEILRLRGMIRGAIENGLPKAALRLMEPELRSAVNDGEADLEEEATYILRKAARGSTSHQKLFNTIVAKAGITHHMLNVVAYSMSPSTINALEDAIAKAERRRELIMRDMEKRRKSLVAMKPGSRGQAAPVLDIEPAANDPEAGPQT